MAAAAAERQGCVGMSYEDFAVLPPVAARPADPRARRHLLPAVFLRLDPFPARRGGNPPLAAQQLARARRGHAAGHGRPLRLLAAVVPRHGAGRLPAVADRQPDVDRLPAHRGFRPPPARLARPDQPQRGHHALLFADLRLRHLRPPHLQPEPRRGPLRPVALAARRQRRRHDPARRHAELRQRLRRCRFQGQRLLPELRPGRGHAGRHPYAAGRRNPRRTGRGRTPERLARATSAAPRATGRSSIAASRCSTWRSRSAAKTAMRAAITRSARSGARARA